MRDLRVGDFSSDYIWTWYQKLAESYEALLHLATAIIAWRKIAPIYG